MWKLINPLAKTNPLQEDRPQNYVKSSLMVLKLFCELLNN